MERTLILNCNQKIGEKVRVYGWVQVRRDHGKIVFLNISDRSGLIQVVAKETEAQNLHPQDVIYVEGKVNKRPENLINKNLETGEIELQAEKIEVLAKAQELPFDIGGKDLNLQLPTLLDFRSLALRHPKVRDIFKVQAVLMDGFRKAAKDLDCVEIFVPTLAASSTEGGAEVFRVDYFEYKAFLTQSPQLYKQMLVPVFERVFTIAHAYRAEPSVDIRHLTESTQLDCEFGFVTFEDLLDYLEQTAITMLKTAEENCSQILKNYGVEKIKMEIGKVPRIILKEAQEIIFKEFGRDVRGEKDLNPQDELDLGKWALEKYESDLLTITHYPTSKRAFYTLPDPKDPEYSLSYDLLFRGVEMLSGSQRINDYHQLVKAIEDRGMNPKNFEMYLQAFKYGMPPEGGFSFGLERMTMNVLKLDNIREASLFPRDMERVDVRLSTLK